MATTTWSTPRSSSENQRGPAAGPAPAHHVPDQLREEVSDHDLLVTVEVAVPQHPSEPERQALQALADAMQGDPRASRDVSFSELIGRWSVVPVAVSC